MTTLIQNSDQENQRFFQEKENIVGHNKKNVLPKNQRTIFGTLSENVGEQYQLESTKFKAEFGCTEESYVTPSQIQPAVEKIEPDFQIYEDVIEVEYQTEFERETTVRVQEKNDFGTEGNSMHVESDYLPSDKYSSSENRLQSKIENLNLTPEKSNKACLVAYEYIHDNYAYLKSAELEVRPRPNYLDKQDHIDAKMRATLIDWIVAVTTHFNMQTETLYLAVSYIDRFLSKMKTVKSKLQLVGTAALMIAAKFEEISVPSVDDYVYLTDDSYTCEEVIKMEKLILRVFAFDVMVPTAIDFLKLYCHYAGLPDKVKFLSMFVCELSLMETIPYLKFPPSHLAAASVALARHAERQEVWPRELEIFSGYTLEDLRFCVVSLENTYKNSRDSKFTEIRKKYESSDYMRVSLVFPRSTTVFDCEDETTLFF